MASIHNFTAVAELARHDADAATLLERIVSGAGTVLELAKYTQVDPNAKNNIYVLATSIGHAAEKVAVLRDEQDRLRAQYIRRLAQLLREQVASTDPLKIEALAHAIRTIAAEFAPRQTPPPA